MAKRTPTIEHVNASIARWKTRLKRAINALDKLDRQKRRIEAKAGIAPTTKPMIVKVNAPQRAATMIGIAAPDRPAPDPVPESVVAPVAPTMAAADLTIPDFLKRTKPTPEAAQILAEQAETKKLKARGRIEKMKAKKSGDTKRMPLTGKAAMDLIRNG
jgi:hypothetical protein